MLVYDYTKNMEDNLDEISKGKKTFWIYVQYVIMN